MAAAVHDPLEGLTADGIIRTGVNHRRIADRYASILDAVIEAIESRDRDASVYVYGSVATGTARPPSSDVDVLTIGLDDPPAADVAARLTTDFAADCRGVEIGAAMPDDFEGPGDAAYGGRVFLHHYCVHLAGPDRDRATSGFPGDRRAARGFNGDIARHADRWRAELTQADPHDLARRIGRKTLLAVAGLVSVHDGTWTTSRHRAARRWAGVHPELAAGLATLLTWSPDPGPVDRHDVAEHLDHTVGPVVEQFAETIGHWDD